MPATSSHSTDCSDEQLAVRVQGGCAASFAALDQRLRPRLLHVLGRRLSTREDAEDVVQQTLLRVFEKIHLYDSRQRLSPWVFTIALRLAAQLTRRKRVPLVPESDDRHEYIDRARLPEDQVSSSEQREQLWTLADKVLKPEQWTALWLFYGEEQSISEVAQSLGKTKTSVRVLLFRARRTLLPHLRRLKPVMDSSVEAQSQSPYPATLLVGQCAGGLDS